MEEFIREQGISFRELERKLHAPEKSLKFRDGQPPRKWADMLRSLLVKDYGYDAGEGIVVDTPDAPIRELELGDHEKACRYCNHKPVFNDVRNNSMLEPKYSSPFIGFSL